MSVINDELFLGTLKSLILYYLKVLFINCIIYRLILSEIKINLGHAVLNAH